jgi:hypothetical protein
VTYRNNWGEDRVFFHTAEGRLDSVPARWTDLVAPDPFVAISAGRALSRVEDLLALVRLVRGVRP